MDGSDDDNIDFTIRIRGVGVYVANANATEITEVLFPQAERNPPDGYDGSDSSKMKHADKSKAHEHFAGALLIKKDGSSVSYDLGGCRVELTVGGGAGAGASIQPEFLETIPPLDAIIDQDRRLRLLAESQRTNKERVAMRLMVDGGTLRSCEGSDQDWLFDDPPGSRSAQEYFLEGTWTISAPTLTFEATDLITKKHRHTIVLDDSATELFFYNFDEKNPDKLKLRHKERAKPGLVDDDFKWVYQLFEKDYPTWQEWMTSDALPAPKIPLDGVAPVVSVSTCFEVVWTGPIEPDQTH